MSYESKFINNYKYGILMNKQFGSIKLKDEIE